MSYDALVKELEKNHKDLEVDQEIEIRNGSSNQDPDIEINFMDKFINSFIEQDDKIENRQIFDYNHDPANYASSDQDTTSNVEIEDKIEEDSVVCRVK